MSSPHGKIWIVEDERYRDHRGPDGHPECPERLIAVHEALSAFDAAIERRPPRPAEADEILRVHGRDHLARVEEVAALGNARYDADTYSCHRSFEVARLAAGGAVDLARAIATGEVACGFAAVRPPGHHAESDRAMGFCLFNNIAIAARALQAEGVSKLMILDWDVHHGNGTQHCFEDDPSVLYVSTHQFPYYPGTGAAGERGRGRGEGTTVNVPMPAGCGDVEYVGVFERLVVPVARAFGPELLLVSCGFDAHRDDPLASMEVTDRGFLAMSEIVCGLARDLCDGHIAFVLEGGYSATGLRQGTTAVLRALTTEPTGIAKEIRGEPEKGSPLKAVVDQVAAVHRDRYPGLGAA